MTDTGRDGRNIRSRNKFGMTDKKIMKLFKQKFTSILLATAFLVGAISTVNFALKTEAASQAAGDLTIEYPSTPLFNASNIAPGYEEIKTITVTNNGTVPHNFSLALSGAVGDLAEVLRFEPRNFDTQVPYWNHTLSEISASSDGFVILNSINPSQIVKIDLAAILPTAVGNDYQGKTVTTFGIIFGVDSSFETPIISAFGSGGGGDATGAGAVGGIGTNSLTSSGRNISFAGPSVSDTQVQVEPTTEQSSEVGQVLGEATTKGAETGSKIWCYWWLVLLIAYAIFLIIYGIINYRANGVVFGWMWPIFVGVVLYLVHWILHDYYTAVKLCGYFIWFEIGELAVYYILTIIFSRTKKAE